MHCVTASDIFLPMVRGYSSSPANGTSARSRVLPNSTTLAQLCIKLAI